MRDPTRSPLRSSSHLFRYSCCFRNDGPPDGGLILTIVPFLVPFPFSRPFFCKFFANLKPRSCPFDIGILAFVKHYCPSFPFFFFPPEKFAVLYMISPLRLLKLLFLPLRAGCYTSLDEFPLSFPPFLRSFCQGAQTVRIALIGRNLPRLFDPIPFLSYI